MCVGKSVKKLVAAVLLFFAMVALPHSAMALSGKEHVDDMLGTLDVDDVNLENKFYDLTWATDDYQHKVLNQLNNINPNVKLGGLGAHRCLFHCGFDSTPNEVLKVEQVQKYLNQLSPQERRRAEKIIKDGWQHVQGMVDELMIANDIPKSKRAAARAAVSLLYDVHILGDYQTTSTESLASVSDIDKSIRKSLATVIKDKNALKKIEYDLDVLRSKSEKRNSAEYAKRLRNYLKNAKIGQYFVDAGILKPDQINANGTVKASAYNQIEKMFAGNTVARMYLNYQNFQDKCIPKKLHGTMNVGLTTALVSGLANTYKVVKGEKELRQALGDVAVDTGSASTAQYVTDGIIQKVGNGKYAMTVLIDEANRYQADKTAGTLAKGATKGYVAQQSTGALLQYGVATFIFDESRHVWGLARGTITKREFVKQTTNSVIKSSAAGGAAYCTVMITGLSTANPVVGAIAMGGYILANAAINHYDKLDDRNYLFVEDVLVKIPVELLHRPSPFNIKTSGKTQSAFRERGTTKSAYREYGTTESAFRERGKTKIGLLP